MIVYMPIPEEGYEWIDCVNVLELERVTQLDGNRIGDEWEPLEVHSIAGKTDSRADFPWLTSSALVMRERAYAVLQEVTEANGEVLPLSNRMGDQLQLFNAQCVNALDEANSDIWRLPRTGQIMDIRKIEFVESEIVGLDIFRLNIRGSSTYVSERFVQCVEDNGLVGLKFSEVWSSNASPS